MQDQYRYVLGAALRPLNSARSRKGEREHGRNRVVVESEWSAGPEP